MNLAVKTLNEEIGKFHASIALLLLKTYFFHKHSSDNEDFVLVL